MALRDLLREAGYSAAERVGSAQRRQESGLADVEGTPYWAESKADKSLPITLWAMVMKCLSDRGKKDKRPILLRLNKTGRQYPPLVVMLEREWVEMEEDAVDYIGMWTPESASPRAAWFPDAVTTLTPSTESPTPPSRAGETG